MQRSGRTTEVVDKGSAVGGGSTSSSSAVVRYNFSTLAGVTAAWESAHRWWAWADHLGMPGHTGPLAAFHRCPGTCLPGTCLPAIPALPEEDGYPEPATCRFVFSRHGTEVPPR